MKLTKLFTRLYAEWMLLNWNTRKTIQLKVKNIQG